VRAIVRSSPGAVEELDVECVRADVTDPASLEGVFDGVDVVYHLAAIISLLGDQQGRVQGTNVYGTRNVARAALASGVRRFVHFSSVHAFDLTDRGLPIDESSPRPPRSAPNYDRSKAAGEAAVRAVAAEGLDVVVVHPSGVIGPNDFGPSPMGEVVEQLGEGKMPMLIEGGFDWVDVRDVVEGALAAEERGRTGESYILSGAWASIREIAELARECTGSRVPPVAPMWLVQLGAPLMDFIGRLGLPTFYTSEMLHPLVSARQIDHSRAREELDYSPRPLRETLRDIYSGEPSP